MSALQEKLGDLVRQERLPLGFISAVERFYRPLAKRVFARHAVTQRMMIVGICGPQGSGKSTMAAFLRVLLEDAGLQSAILSLDDLYLTRAEREKLAQDIHPLLITRGPPGTHDIPMGLRLLNQLRQGGADRETPIPRFDKSIDDRAPNAQWPPFIGRPDIVLFEGWCVGAKAQSETALAKPINALERERDADGIWRRYVNSCLAGPYQQLFKEMDLLVMLKPPSFDCVLEWRVLQEEKLRERAPAGGLLMSRDEIATFIMHYERVTRHLLAEMPARADIVLEIDKDHGLVGATQTSQRSD